LDDAVDRGLAEVTEVSREGSVPELAFENRSAEKILLVDGDELVGAKQNRILNITLLVGGGVKVNIPVSCVEQGRWSYNSRSFGSARRALFARARAKKMVRVSESLRQRGDRRSDQSEVWADVAAKVAFCRAESDTMAMADAYDKTASRLEDYVRAFRAQPRQVGAVVALDGRVTGLEVFDSAAAFSRYLEKLVRANAMDALETAGRPASPPSPEEVQAFLAKVQRADAETFKALGDGEDVRLRGKSVAGAALLAEGRVVHLAGYAVDEREMAR
ncbi:MAG: ARPP-1 family domain-containing protein, partial [Betaproteobacteria bacterium]